MYKFLVVDDEEIVRRGFRQKIPWEEAGFQFLEPCENGRDAIRTIERERPDVVMTDICMPLADGLEVASYVADNHPEIVVVVLSGYDDFEYARSALRSRVVEYLLKPITSRELLAVVRKLKEQFDSNEGDRRASEGGPSRQTPDWGIYASRSPSFALSKVAEAQEYIEHNHANKLLSIEKACTDLFISQSYLSRLLRRHTGRTFVDLLTECRVSRAGELLRGTDLKTYAVAEAVGYSDPHYFSTIFKKATGVTPTEFREAEAASGQP
ncbi:MAG TPA: response regulator [Spirochaetia bacterium]|nr:response regulator [Spirochaetia bacterium]